MGILKNQGEILGSFSIDNLIICAILSVEIKSDLLLVKQLGGELYEYTTKKKMGRVYRPVSRPRD